jgi:hypothetical protein
MHAAPCAPASQAAPELLLPPLLLPDRQTLFVVSQILLQQSEFRLQGPPATAQPAPESPRAPLLLAEEELAPPELPEDDLPPEEDEPLPLPPSWGGM